MTTTLSLDTAEVFEPLLEPCRYKGARGGRGSGKSRFFVDMLIEDCLREPGMRALGIREYQTSLKQSVKPAIENRIREMGKAVYDMFECQNSVTRTPGGGEIVYQGMQNHNADSVKSFEGFRRAFVEEAHSLSQRSWNLLYPTLRAPGAEIWCAWNPNKPTDAVDKFFREAKEANRSDVRMVVANYWDNPWFPESLRQDMEYDKRRDPELYRHIWCGEYQTRSSAAVFKHGVHWRIGDEKEFLPINRLDRVYYGADFGYAKDPSTLVELSIDQRDLYISREAFGHGVEIDMLPFLYAGCEDEDIIRRNRVAYGELTLTQKELWKGIPECYRWPIIADSARPETIAYLRRRGFPKMSASKKGKDSIREGIKFLQRYNIIIHPSCIHTIDEFTHYAYKIDPRTEEVLDVLADDKNHIIDPARYALEPLRRATIGVH